MSTPLFDGRYVLEQPLRRMGPRRIWRATDRLTQRPVVIKGAISSPGSTLDRAVRLEFSTLVSLNHPRIARALELNHSRLLHLPAEAVPHIAPLDSFTYFTQPFLEGPSLRQLAARLSPGELLEWLVDTLELVGFLHTAGLHRLDLKSDHLLRQAGRWHLIDLDQARVDSPFEARGLSGAISYVAPEVLTRQGADLRSDLYAVGAMLFEAITGEVPELQGETLEQIGAWLPDSRVPALPPAFVRDHRELSQLCTDLLARDPARRPPSAFAALERCTPLLQRPVPPRTLPRGPLVGRASLIRALETGLLARAAAGGVLRLRGPERAGHSRLLETLHLALLEQGQRVSRWTADEWRIASQAFSPDRPAPGAAEAVGLNLLCGWLEGLLPDPEDRTSAAQTTHPIAPDCAPSKPAASTRTATHRSHASSEPAHDREAQPDRKADVQRRFFAAAARACEQLGQAPCLLIDDLAQLDEASLLLLRICLPLLEGSGVRMVVADPEPVPGQSELLTGGQCLCLPALTPADARALADALLGPGAIAQLALESLLRQTDGQVGALREALLLYDADPSLPLEHWRCVQLAALRGALLSRLSRGGRLVAFAASVLPEGASALELSLLATWPPLESWLDEHFQAEPGPALSRASQPPSMEPQAPVFQHALSPHPSHGGRSGCRQGIEDALRSGILVVHTLPGQPADSSFKLAREGWRQALESGLPASLVQGLRVQAAEHLESLVLSQEQHDANPARAGQLGWLYLRAELPHAARSWLDRALTGAEAQGSNLEAARILRLLLETFGTTHPARATLLRRLGQLEYERGDHAAAKAAFEAGLELHGLPPLLQARLTAGLALLHVAQNRLEQAVQLYGQALTALEGSTFGIREPGREAQREHLLWTHRVVDALLRQQKVADACEILVKIEQSQPDMADESRVDHCYYKAWAVLSLAGPVGAPPPAELTRHAPHPHSATHPTIPQPEGSAKGASALPSTPPHTLPPIGAPGVLKPDQLEAWITRGIALARGAELERSECNLLSLLGEVQRTAHKLEEAEASFSALATREARCFRLPQEAAALQNLGRVQKSRGKLEPALEAFSRSARLQKRLNNATGELASRLEIADLLLWLELPPRAEQAVEQVHACLPETLPPQHRLRRVSQELSLRLALLQGRLQGLRPAFDALLHEAEGQKEVELTRQLRLDLAQLARREGRQPELVALLERIEAQNEAHAEGPAPVHVRQALDALHSSLHPVQDGPGEDSSARLLSREAEAGAWLARYRKLIAPNQDDQELVTTLAEFVGSIFDGRGLVVVYSPGGRRILGRSGLSATDQDDISDAVLDRVRSTQKEVICPDIRTDRELSRAHSLLAANVRSVVCWPIRQEGRMVGALYVDRVRAGSLTEPGPLALIESLALLAGELLELRVAPRREEELDLSLFPTLVGTSPAMRSLRQQLQKALKVISPSDSIMLLGERGVGKSWIAGLIHQFSRHSKGTFHDFCCAGSTEHLVETELVGYGPNSGFANANPKGKPGLLEVAGGGTLLLDEVGDMPLSYQAKLLLILSTRCFSRSQDQVKHQLETNLIFATNKDLRQLEREGAMRPDFKDRVMQHVVEVPSLRARGPADIRLLLEDQIRQIRPPSRTTPVRLEHHFKPSALRLLEQHSWPGNVRELIYLVRDKDIRPLLAAGEPVALADVETFLETRHGTGSGQNLSWDHLVGELPANLTFDELKSRLASLTSRYILERARQNGMNVAETARSMGCERFTLYDNCSELARRSDSTRKGRYERSRPSPRSSGKSSAPARSAQQKRPGQQNPSDKPRA